MRIKVMLFGSLADVIGNNQIEMSDVPDTETLTKKLLEKYPKLEKYKFVVAVYKQIIEVNTALKEGDKVSLLPPFSGG